MKSFRSKSLGEPKKALLVSKASTIPSPSVSVVPSIIPSLLVSKLA